MWRWVIWKTMLILTAVFIAGVTLGVVGTVHSVQRTFRERMDPHSWQPRTEQWLRKDLGLGDQQISQARPEIERYVHELIGLRDQTEQRRREIISQFLMTLAQGLTPEQIERLKAIAKEKEQQTASAGYSMP